MAVDSSVSTYFTFLILLNFSHFNYASHGNRICNRTYATRFHTTCAPCAVNARVGCPVGTKKLTRGNGRSDCYYRMIVEAGKVVELGITFANRQNIRRIGCRHTCKRKTMELICCKDLITSTANVSSTKYSGQKGCACPVGYNHDGQNCVAIDPCMEKAQCTRSTCVYTEPGKYGCICKMGYIWLRGKCRRINLCHHDGGECDENADCKMVYPSHFKCMCKDGYRGNGRKCYNNLLDLIGDLNQYDPDLRSILHTVKHMVSQAYSKELRNDGPFTLFLPNDNGFNKFLENKTNNTTLETSDEIKQFLRQHIVLGNWRMDELAAVSEIYNLQSAKIMINTEQRNGKSFYVVGYQASTDKAVVIKHNIKAANGIIHVLNDTIYDKDQAEEESNKSILQIIKEEGRFNSFYDLIKRADMTANFSLENITVFLSENTAWDTLSDDKHDYIRSDEGLEKLKLILSHHIFIGKIDVGSIVTRNAIRSSAGVDINITISMQGKVQLGDMANLTKPDLSAQNGLIHLLDGLILPVPINEILPSKCFYKGIVQVLGREIFEPKDRQELKCEKRGDMRTDEITCRFITGGWGNQYKVCRIICNRKAQVPGCCRGFYGPYCLPCPGGFKLPCSGKGQCLDGKTGNGTCQCDENHTGEMCDKCAENMFGPDCAKRNRICEDSNPCGENTTCSTTSPDEYKCVCEDGYHGDGLECTPIDVCQTDYGGCDKNVSTCVYSGPGKRDCNCKDGYENVQGKCHMIDLCRQKDRFCDKNAHCLMVSPSNVSCTCVEGYEGDGKTCLMNLADLLDSLFKGDSIMKYFYMLIRSHFTGDLRTQGPFTIFLPHDAAFQEFFINRIHMASFFRSYRESTHILRQHMTAGERSTTDLKRNGNFYTLQGIKAEVKIKRMLGSYRLFGSRTKAYFVNPGIKASNGIIHIVDKLLTRTSVTKGDEFKPMLKVMEKEARFNRFRTFIRKAGVEANLKSDNITVFAPSNYAWDNLPKNAMTYLFSEAGKEDLRALVLNHIIDDVDYEGVFKDPTDLEKNIAQCTTYIDIHVTGLINVNQIQTMAGYDVNVTVTKQGQVQLAEMANISQTDILTNNGLIHRIDGLLIPKCIEQTLLSRCDYAVTTRVRGFCYYCEHLSKETPICKKGDAPTNESAGCFIQGGWMQQYQGCAQICLRTQVQQKCCAGYYGPDCLPCPRKFDSPCSGNGKCYDGVNGTGTCQCDVGFHGDICDQIDNHV